MDRQDLVILPWCRRPRIHCLRRILKPLRDIFLGLITALLLGVIAVFLMESVRDTLGAASELERWSRYPGPATVPG